MRLTLKIPYLYEQSSTSCQEMETEESLKIVRKKMPNMPRGKTGK